MPFLSRPFRAVSATRAFRISRTIFSNLPRALPLLCVAAFCVALVVLAPGARAATVWHVSPGNAGACTQADPNCATIQAAVTAASAGDTIQVAAGTYAEHVTVNKNLTVNGAGAALTFVDGTQTGTVFTVNTAAVSLSGMTIANGKTSANGGGIFNNGATLSVNGCTIGNNSANGDGGGIANDNGTLNVTSSTVSSNFAASGGGGISNSNAGTLSVANSTVNNNSAVNDGGGIFNFNDSTANITNSTVTNNSANIGGGILNSGAVLTVTSSTISNNSATVTNCDCAGGGILNEPGGVARIRSSIVAGNTGFGSLPDFSGHFTSQGHNLVGATNGLNGFTNGTNNDIVGTLNAPVDAKLAPLGFYGGPTQTRLLLCGSPAIDAGDDTLLNPPPGLTTDQRGVAREAGAHVDIGAVERQQAVQVNSQDSGAGSLRQLILDAQDGAIIDLDPCTSVTVTLTSDELLINKNLTINGPGPSLLTVQRSDAQGTPAFRIFEVAAGKSFNLSGMAPFFGRPSANGGAILNSGGTLNVTNDDISNNGGGGLGGGGIFNNAGTVNVTSCKFTNDAGPGGGAILNNGGTLNVTASTITGDFADHLGGGILISGGTASVTKSTVSSNIANDGGGIANSGTLSITSSTVNSNVTNSPTMNGGAGIYNHGGTLTLTNSTISDNTADLSSIPQGGGLLNDNGGAVNVTSTTVSSNFAASGGGGISNSSGTVNVRSSIVAGNTSNNISSPDLRGTFTSQGHNLVGAGDSSTGFTGGTNGDIVGTASAPVDPLLRRLGNYGGPTQTRLLRPSSPAIDAGDDAVLDPPLGLTADQRGVARKIGSHVDIGSVELNPDRDIPGGVFQFSSNIYPAPEGSGHIDITVTRTGQFTQPAAVDFATADNDPSHLLPCSQVSGNASSRCDYEATSGTLQFAAGEFSKSFTVLINEDAFVEGTETAKLVLSNPAGDSTLGQQSTATLQIFDNDSSPSSFNPIDDTTFFVRQHYRDFLNREADLSGLQFWMNGITSCGSDANCVAVKRVDTSAAFFLSIEFQNTGYFVYRVYKVSFGDINPPAVPVPVRLDKFLRDTQTVGQGVIVGQGNWRQQLATNKGDFVFAFVQRADFLARYPSLTSASSFVNSLDANAGGVLTDAEKSSLVSELSPNPSDDGLRADVLQKVAENATLQQREFNRAFVLMQYFGYLRRNPDDAPDANFNGYNFWLSKLNSFGGDFQKAEMVRAFIESAEYRQRFGP
jgi:Calx-beta domain